MSWLILTCLYLQEPSHQARGALPRLIAEDMLVMSDFELHKCCLHYKVLFHFISSDKWERNGSVVECLTQDRKAAGSSLTGITVLCP